MIGLLTTGRHDLSYLGPVEKALRASGAQAVWLDSPPGIRHIEVPAQAVRLAEDTMERMPWQCHISKVSRAVVLGDRTETLAACVALTILRIPIAHIHGGDVTLGAIDNVCRNAISQLADMHFAVTQDAVHTLLRMNVPGTVYMTGSPSVDLILSKPRKRIHGKDIVFSYHPETLSDLSPLEQIQHATRVAMNRLKPGGKIICTGVNPDAGGSEIMAYLKSLGEPFIMRTGGTSEGFWDLLSTCDCMVGNSSAGVIEAPVLGVEFVEVGDRQKGRYRGSYGDGHACERIAKALLS